MKTKLLFTAALMAATVGTQAVPSTGSSMLVQLLESQRLENNVEVLAEGDKERPTEDNTDVTSWIVNPSFDENNTNGWTFSQGGVGFAGTNDYYGGIPEAYADRWTHNLPIDLNQQLAGLPCGKYEVSVQAWGGVQPILYAEGNSYVEKGGDTGIQGTLADVDATFKNDSESHRIKIENIVVSGNLKIGIKCTATEGWLVFDNFKLKYG